MWNYKMIVPLIFLTSFRLFAQSDSTYYVTYNDKLTTRFYFSQKYTRLAIHNEANNVDLTYRPNTTLNMGIGATYRWATLNLAYGFGFLNPDKGQGKTQYLDLQFHNYSRKVVVDAFGQFYKGFFLAPKGDGRDDGQYYVRPDLSVYELGLNVQYVLNHKRYSHRAGILQDEWQKKSAGSFLLGAEVYWGNILADSTIIPAKTNKELAAQNINKLFFFQIGPNVGYTYTLIIKKHYFIAGSLSVSMDYGSNTSFSDAEGEQQQIGFSPNTFVRAFAGYNSDVWAFSIVYLNDGVNLATGGEATRATLNTGNIRVNLVRRFPLLPRMKKILKIMDL